MKFCNNQDGKITEWVSPPPPKPPHEHRYIYGGTRVGRLGDLYDWWWCRTCLDQQYRSTTIDIEPDGIGESKGESDE